MEQSMSHNDVEKSVTIDNYKDARKELINSFGIQRRRYMEELIELRSRYQIIFDDILENIKKLDADYKNK